MLARPWIGCGIASDIVVTAHGTLGESQTRPNGRPYDKGDLTNQLQRGQRAFNARPDSNGIPDRDDAQRIHRAMFPGLPDLIPLLSRDFDEVVEVLRGDDYAVSLAMYLPAMPAGLAITQYTRAPHQSPFVGIENGKSRSQDPMHAPQLSWAGRMVPLTQMQKAAKAFPDSPGLVMAWKVPIGGWTQGALAAEAVRDRLREARDDLELSAAQLANKAETIADLKRQLEQAGNVDCSDAVAAEHERTLVAAIAKLEAMRSA
jgi:hypothetical protein